MIIEFKSKAAGAFFMTEPVARLVLSAAGLDYAEKGIVIAERVPEVRKTLALAIARSKQQDQDRLVAHEEAVREGEASSRETPVGLSQRAHPFLEMLTAAERQQVAVVWGV